MKLREILEGMNQNKQKGMLSKEHFEKLLSIGKNVIVGADKLWLNTHKKWMVNSEESKFTKLYQIYRAGYKNKQIA